jgi:hypothetical protein
MLNTFAPTSCDLMSSNVGILKCGLRIYSFSALRVQAYSELACLGVFNDNYRIYPISRFGYRCYYLIPFHVIKFGLVLVWELPVFYAEDLQREVHGVSDANGMSLELPLFLETALQNSLRNDSLLMGYVCLGGRFSVEYVNLIRSRSREDCKPIRGVAEFSTM